MQIQYRMATVADIESILALHARYQVDSIHPNDKADGFVTTAFNQTQLTDLIESEQGLFVAQQDTTIIAYAMAASWTFWSQWPMFAHMIKELDKDQLQQVSLSVENSYQYGPVCVDKAYRGQGVFEGIFFFALQQMHSRYPILVTFINKINPRSFAAHTKKAKLQVIKEFEFNQNQYYELACFTKP